MRIIIEVKDTATLERIDLLRIALTYLQVPPDCDTYLTCHNVDFGDVIKSISRE